MTTKEEYIDTLRRMNETYDDLDCSTSAMHGFKKGVCLLTELVNEHFESRQETNLDHYKDDIAELFIDKLALVDGKPERCKYVTVCDFCDLYEKCAEHKAQEELRKWLKQPYEKPIYKLNQFEYDLLQLCSVDFKFKEMIVLKEMKEKGHFKNIDSDKLIEDILENCEVIE